MLAELEGHTGTTVEEQQIICVYQMTLTISSTRVEYKHRPILLEWIIGILDIHLCLLLMITMLPVLCAMWPTEV